MEIYILLQEYNHTFYICCDRRRIDAVYCRINVEKEKKSIKKKKKYLKKKKRNKKTNTNYVSR